MTKVLPDIVEIIVLQKENTSYQQFLHFSQCSQESSSSRLLMICRNIKELISIEYCLYLIPIIVSGDSISRQYCKTLNQVSIRKSGSSFISYTLGPSSCLRGWDYEILFMKIQRKIKKPDESLTSNICRRRSQAFVL